MSAIVLGACGSSTSDGRSLAQQACVHVDRSVTDWVRAGHAGTTNATALSLMNQADLQLRAALPLAAAANSADGTWNALMTTISESETVDEGHLVSALRAQCSAADSSADVNPATPGSGNGADTGGATGSGSGGGSVRTTVPQNVNPKPASSAG